jgi:hypothetical protein
MDSLALKTADALAYAGLDPVTWRNAMLKGLYPAAPSYEPGHPRFFKTDDLVALELLGKLIDIGVLPRIACRIASDFHARLRSDNRLKELYLVTIRDPDGSSRAELVKEPPENAVTLLVIRVDKARRMAREAIAAGLAIEDGGDDGRPQQR